MSYVYKIKWTILLVLSLAYTFTIAQENVFYETIVTSNEVDSLSNSIDGDITTYASIRASSGLALQVGAYNGYLELQAPTLLDAGTTTYLRIDTEEDLLSPLLGGSLGDLISTATGVLLIGNQEFTIEAKNRNDIVLSGQSNNPADFGSEDLRVVVDSENNFYIAITPNSAYDSLRITNRTGSLIGLNTVRQLNVYGAFYRVSEEGCGLPQFTSYDGNGITLEVLNNGAGVENAHLAIDQNNVTYAELGLGIIDVAASIEQQVNFVDNMSAGELYAVTLSIDSSLLSVGILNNLQFHILNNGVIQETFSASTLLTVELLTNLENGQAITLYFEPTTSSDALSIQLSSLLGVSLEQQIRLHEVTRLPVWPTLDSNSENITLCNGETANIVAYADASINQATINWYDAETGGVLLASTESGESFVTPALSANTTYFASISIAGCPNESPRVAANVTVVDQPTADDITVTGDGQVYCSTSSIFLHPESTIDGTFEWYFDIDMNQQITDGAVQDGITYALDGTGGLQVQGMVEAQSPLVLYINIVEEMAGCSIPQGSLKPVSLAVNDNSFLASINTDYPLDYNNIVGNLNLDNTITLTGTVQGDAVVGDSITLNIGGQIYATTVLAGLSFNIDIDADAIFQDNDAEVEVLIESVSEGCADLDSISINVPEIEVAELLQYFCASDTTTIADITVNGSFLTWFDASVGGNELNLTTELENGGQYYVSLEGIPTDVLPRIGIETRFYDVENATTNSTNQIFCSWDAATVADIQVDGETILFYDSLFGGTLVLQNSPLINGNTYYAANVVAGCEDTDRLAITVEFIDVPLPTTDEIVQVFCSSDDPTVIDLQVTGDLIVFYDAAVGGIMLPADEVLVDGETYFASNFYLGCESSSRIAITVDIIDVPPPTTTSQSQEFCETDNPTIADIQVNESDVVWYDAAEGGNELSTEEPLEDGRTYYAANRLLGCESTERLDITVGFIDVEPPTTENQNQMFCVAGGPTINDIQINDENIVWYDAPIDGNTLPSDHPLVDGASYYASQIKMGCEGTDRLQVNITLLDDGSTTPLTGEFEEACLSNTETYTTLSGMANYEWVVTGGEIVEGGTAADNFVTVRWVAIENTTISVAFTTTQCNTVSEQLTVVNVVSCVLSANFGIVVYNEFSPNNDGFNDTFRIEGIDDLLANVEIYNRYGRLVYKGPNYQNNWNGIANVEGVLKKGEYLPSGTYFYVVIVPELNQKLTGWLQLAR